MGIQDVDALAAKPARGANDVKGKRPLAEGEMLDRQTGLVRTFVNATGARREQGNGAAPAVKPGQFGKDALFLAAPAERAFRVCDAPQI